MCVVEESSNAYATLPLLALMQEIALLGCKIARKQEGWRITEGNAPPGLADALLERTESLDALLRPSLVAEVKMEEIIPADPL